MKNLAECLNKKSGEQQQLSVREMRYAKMIVKCLGERIKGISIVGEKNKLQPIEGKEEEAVREVLMLLARSEYLKHEHAGKVLGDNRLTDLVEALFRGKKGENEQDKRKRLKKIIEKPIVHKYR